MTREEAIEVVKERLGYYEREKRLRAACEILIPELAESEDERIRKELIEFIKWSVDRHFMREDFHQAKRPSEWIAYLEKQKEQDKCPEYCVRSHCIGCSIYEKEKEKWPIMDVFGFKVGDAVRLKDGDGRKHIIKAFEEIEGVHGPNFYHVEFEDNSARDGIYPGEEYPNGYYTQMEKFEEEQKPVEWSEEDEEKLERVDDLLWMLDDYIGDDCSIGEERTKRLREEIKNVLCPFLKSLRPQKLDASKLENFDPVDVLNRIKTEWPMAWEKVVGKQEWSEEDEKMLKSITGDLFCGTDFNMELKFAASKKVNWLKDKLKSLRSCTSWKPSEEQMKALRECGECKRCIKELYEDLKKRYGTC